MALTKVTNDLQDALAAAQPTITSVGTLTNFTSTGIDDNATSTAITIDASENVGIGTSSPTTFSGYVTVHHKNTSGDAIHLIESDGGIIGQTVINDASGVVTMGARSNHPWRVTTNDTERLRIDTSGRVTMPYQPAFAVKASATVTGANVWTGNTASVNVGGHWDTSTYRFTAPVAGNYAFNGSWLNNSSTNLYIFIRKNGANQANGYANPFDTMATINWVLSLAVNDYVDILIQTGTTYGGAHQMFSGHLIG
jgi:hypothetical protein